jgi:fructosamine-3-kinase
MIRRAEDATGLIGETVRAVRRLHGGDLSEVLAIELADGRTVVAKSGRSARAEAEMLRAIRMTGAPAPEVLAESEDLLVLECLADDGSLNDAGRSLGDVVGRLHAGRGDSYGWPVDHSFGRVPIRNARTENWPEFWAEQRLLPSVEDVDAGTRRRIERLAQRLTEILPKSPPPSLLHGDLWSGNILASGGEVTGLIDPACYYGDGEVDLAMLSLFGAPGGAFRESYGAAAPGSAARQPVYQLWPALVHLRLFGAGYAGMVDRLLRAAGV